VVRAVHRHPAAAPNWSLSPQGSANRLDDTSDALADAIEAFPAIQRLDGV
jgi:hypothetical protein